MDYTVHGILQSRILEWVAPSAGDLLNSGIKPRSPTLQADTLPAEGREAQEFIWEYKYKEVISSFIFEYI